VIGSPYAGDYVSMCMELGLHVEGIGSPCVGDWVSICRGLGLHGMNE